MPDIIRQTPNDIEHTILLKFSFAGFLPQRVMESNYIYGKPWQAYRYHNPAAYKYA